MPFGWEILWIFFCFLSLFLFLCVPLECGDLESVKFCNNIKRRYGRVNKQLVSSVFFPPLLYVRGLMNDCRCRNFPALVPTHRYFWQAFDAAPWWAVPRRWPLNGVNTPFTVQINAAALCFSEYLIACHLTQNGLQLPIWPPWLRSVREMD